MLVLACVTTYEGMRLAVRPDWPVAVAHAQRIAAWERAAHLAWEAPLQRTLLQCPRLVVGLGIFYLLAQFAATGLFFVWLYHRSRSGFRLFRNGFMIATAIAFIVAWRFQVAPPRLAGIGVEDTVRRSLGIDLGSQGAGGLSDPVAALPSLHAGWALGVAAGIVVHARLRLVKAAATLYPVVVAVAILATGNHFVVDAFAGLLVMVIGLALASAAGQKAPADARICGRRQAAQEIWRNSVRSRTLE
jgi:hypothetical protein